MKIVMFYHSLVSDWNHGNAHFLRGIVADLIGRGHDVFVYEPLGGWSLTNLLADQGPAAVHSFQQAFPGLQSIEYHPLSLDLEAALEDADLVLVHEWNEPELVAAIGRERRRRDLTLLFHDTHHRAVSEPEQMARFDLSNYDGVLAFGNVIRDIYLDKGWAKNAWTWHEAADERLFHPQPARQPEGDLVWIGNWGDEERTAELEEFLLKPVRNLGLRATVYGVRYPTSARQKLEAAGIEYGGWLPNYRVPEVFARHRVTVHVPRRPYAQQLPGIPTIRVFEAMACGIPLVSAPWSDSENLFTPGQDFLMARDGDQMQAHLRHLLDHPESAQQLAAHGRRTILNHHTCAHRVDELLSIVDELAHVRAITANKREAAHA